MKTWLFLWLLLVSSLAGRAVEPGVAESVAGPAVSTETAVQHDARMAWWREARFGMFIHWGLYSVAAGEWEGKPTAGAGEWLMNDQQVPVSHYARLVSQFNPTNFHAAQWVRLAKDAGMKYIVVTTKHHDGFGMFRSSLTDWCIRSTPFEREPLKELAQACRQEDLRLGFYYSIMDWHHPDYAPRKPWNDLATGAPAFEQYLRFLKGQLRELLTDYGPISVVWFDGQWENTWTYERGAEVFNYVRTLQPNIIVNNRVGTELPLQAGQQALGDYRTPEQRIPANGLGPGVDWETCMTMNNTWGYKRSDQDWKSTRTLVRNLIDCASKGGNYLLNVGPAGDGSFPEASVERLEAIGKWMHVNGEAVWGTQASPFPRTFAWGRCTTKAAGADTTLYLHVFDWPGDGELIVPGLRNVCTSARLLSGSQGLSLVTTTSENGLVLSVPREPPDPISSTVVVHLLGAPDITNITLFQKHDGSITLPASEARLHGRSFQYESGVLQDNIGYWTTPEDWVDWEFRVTKPGKFRLSAVIAAAASGSFEVSVAGQTLRCAAPQTGSYVAYKSVNLGQVELPSSGNAILAVRPIKEGWQPMNLKAIRLEPPTASN